MNKKFFDVFPTLKVNQEIRALFEDVEVTKVATNSDRSYLHVHLFSTHLIQKRDIYAVETAIKEQLFAMNLIQIQIIENYQLSAQYTPENLVREYRESILLELKKRSIVEHNMFANAKFHFEEDKILCIEFEDSIVAEGKAESILALLKEVFEERCNIPVDIRVIYHEAKKSKMQEHNALRLQQEVNAIVEQNTAKLDEMKEAKEAEREAKKVAKEEKAAKAANFTKKQDTYRAAKKSDDPNLIYGRDFEDEPMELRHVVGEMGEITFRGQVTSFDTREIRNEKTIVMFAVTDFTDTIMVKMFVRNDQLPDIVSEIRPGAFLKIKGITTIDKFDHELTIASVAGVKKIPSFITKRKDTAPEKRVELHCHTKMSDMDGVSDTKAIVKQAHDWGHSAIAITDHGVVQAFPDANHYIEDLDKEDPFKVIYGVEAYLVDDLTDIAVRAGEQTLDDTYVVFDIETTGFSNVEDHIIEIGAVKVQGGEIVDSYSTFVNPGVPIPFEITNLTSITDEMVMGSPKIDVILPEFLAFVGDAALVAHNASFDMGFIEQNCKKLGLPHKYTYLDTVALARVLLPTLAKYKLNIVAKALGISLENHHRAVDDAGATAEIFVKFVEMLKERDITTLADVNRFGDTNADAIKKMPTYHAIILAKNDVGRVNLYRLISLSHLTYYARRPRIPKSEFLRHREGLIIGSACEAGELYSAIIDNKPEEAIARLVNFYDYLEIQPLGNNQFMIDNSKYENIRSQEYLKDINRKIVKLG